MGERSLVEQHLSIEMIRFENRRNYFIQIQTTSNHLESFVPMSSGLI